MRKRWFLVGMVFLLVPWLLVGCGVPQEKYDVAVSDLGKAQQELQSSKAELETTKTKLAESEATVSSLKEKLIVSEAASATLQTDLASANSNIKSLQGDASTQRTLNSTLTTELKKVKDPAHFSSVAELTDWVTKDDTNTKYASESGGQRSFILQVRALRDGYLLPVSFYFDASGRLLVANRAVIGTYIYSVGASSDQIVEYASKLQPLPSHPLPLD